ncbi:MAG: NAD-dependent epimerase/dehydratase family protein [Clostridia bacterium]|nr:NAD-dependent epimerase/dehydratase family protein [Clostridia bacterium]
MRILVTGAKGFVGKNLCLSLRQNKENAVFEYDIDTPHAELEKWCAECDFVYHLAGVNRPLTEEEFTTGNVGFTTELSGLLKTHKNKAPIVFSSSIQAELDNPYGLSKKAAEDAVKKHAGPSYIYRLPNLFGKWCRPNYNSVVATFCYNIANGLDININDADKEITLAYIDDVVDLFINQAKLETHTIKLGDLANLILSFKQSRQTLVLPDVQDAFIAKLYATYLAYIPFEDLTYPLDMKTDARGAFAEAFKGGGGQVSINVQKPGQTKGQHWHHTKNEKFLTVAGSGKIRMRQINQDKIHEYTVTSSYLEIIDIPPGVTHSIVNTGDCDMVTVIWASEIYDSNRPDTFYEEV